jgi:3-hydroxybutyryl-CoA dehydratase
MKKGDRFEYQFKITNEIYSGFISLFNDKNPLHTNKSFAQEKGFDSVVMHGNILNGFLSYFIGECLPIKNVIIQTQEIKFFKPTYLNDDLNFQADIVDVFESVNMIEIKFVFRNNKDAKVASGKINIGTI